MKGKYEDWDVGLRQMVAVLRRPPPERLPESFAASVTERVLAERGLAESDARSGRGVCQSWLQVLTGYLAALFQPRPVVVRPIFQLAGMVAFGGIVAAMTLWSVQDSGTGALAGDPAAAPGHAPAVEAPVDAPGDAPGHAPGDAPADAYEHVLVRFAVRVPHASQVSVAGDFNAWNARQTPLQDPEGDGVWYALVPVQPGVHQYMFVIDGETWIADPLSGQTVDDGFGQRNSLIRVEPRRDDGTPDPRI